MDKCSNMLMERNRCLEADVAKGLGILLVVHGHACGTIYERILIGAFHMPLFFFLSGLFILHKDITFKGFVVQKAKSLLFPCLIFGIILTTFSTVLDIIKHDDSIPYGLRYVGLFINTRHNPFPGSLWFLPALFLVELLVYCLHKLSYNKKYMIIGSIILAIIGLIINHFYGKGLPWSLDIVLYCTIFTVLGYYLKDCVWKKRNLISYTFASVIFVISAYANFKYLKTNVDLFSCVLGNYILFYISALSGIYLTIGFSQLLVNSRILQYYGRNSIIVYSLHFLVLFFLNYIMGGISCGWVAGILKTVIVSIILVPFINVINSHFRWMTGKFCF